MLDHYRFDPGWSEARAARIWAAAHASVIRDNVTPQTAAAVTLKRIGEIPAKYPIEQA